MSGLHKLLLEVDGVELRWNVVGVDDEGIVNPTKFAIHLFTVNYVEGTGGFDAPLSAAEVVRLSKFLSPFAEQLADTNSKSRLRILKTDDATNTILQLLEGLDHSSLSKVLLALSPTDKLEWLATNLSHVEKEELEASLRFARRRRALDHLKEMIDADTTGDVIALCKEREDLSAYEAGKPETVFQRWFESNTWVLGREYVRRHPLRVIGLDSEADLVMETTDGYLDLIELKRPRARVLGFKKGSKSGQGFHYPHSDLSKAYGQCVRYLSEITNLRYQIQEKHKASVVAPRVFLIIGRSPPAEDGGLDALRRIAGTFHQIEVLSYDQIVAFGERLLTKSEESEA